MIRNAALSDAKRIAEIYNYYIEHTAVTFEKEKVSEEEIRRRMEGILQKNFPYIVYEENGKVDGYASLNNWHPRPAYDITLEASIYLDIESQGNGIGTLLYSELIKRAETLGIHSIIGSISMPNDTSRRLHEKFGFQLAGTLKEAGLKFGKLIDVEFWQLMF